MLAAGLEDWVDFGVICALLLLNASVGFIQEFQAGSIVDELKKTLALKAVVLRDGRLFEVEAPEVVPGDILQIEEVSLLNWPSTNTAEILTSLLHRVPLSLPMAALLPRMPSYKSINLLLLESPSQLTNTRVINAMPHLVSSVARPSWSSLPLVTTLSSVVLLLS